MIVRHKIRHFKWIHEEPDRETGDVRHKIRHFKWIHHSTAVVWSSFVTQLLPGAGM